MNYLSFAFYLLIIFLIFVYYLLPMKYRWTVLLCGSVFFYLSLGMRKHELLLLMSTVFFCYIGGVFIQKTERPKRRKIALIMALIFCASPLLLFKVGSLAEYSLLHRNGRYWIVPVGMSFYTLEMISYLINIYRKKEAAQKNIFKFALYMLFFPKVIQGPITIYHEISSQLFDGNRLKKTNLSGGSQLILWGFFLKFMISDKAGIFVDCIFDNYKLYGSYQLWCAAILYSLQLYTDFLSCVSISRGVALLFGIHLKKNFDHPYFSTSVKDFWHRWHISLSIWLRDYVYIPLGGSKNGRTRKYLNLIITFLISGLWHGSTSFKFILWGFLHAVFQIFGDLTYQPREKIYAFLDMPAHSFGWRFFKSLNTFLLVTLGWVIFRAPGISAAQEIISSMFSFNNPWVLFDDSLFQYGLEWKDFSVLILSVIVLVTVGIIQEKISIKTWLTGQSIVFRCFMYYVVIITIYVFGTYGFGFHAADFIYGGF